MAYATKEENLTPNLQVSRAWQNLDGTYAPIVSTTPMAPGSTYGAINSPISTTGSQGIIGVPDVGKSIYITNLLVTNSNCSIGTRVDIRGGTQVIVSAYIAPEGGYSMSFPIGIKVGNGVGLNGICGTANAAVYISAAGFIGSF